MEPKNWTKQIRKVLDLLKGLTFEPLNGFSNFKSLNDLEFCQESFEITAEVVLAKTKEIGVTET